MAPSWPASHASARSSTLPYHRGTSAGRSIPHGRVKGRPDGSIPDGRGGYEGIDVGYPGAGNSGRCDAGIAGSILGPTCGGGRWGVRATSLGTRTPELSVLAS